MEEPSIGEKVKFWQEQDRINQALIPRVMKVHNSVTELAKGIEGISEHIVQAEARAIESAQQSIEPIKHDMQQLVSQVMQLADDTEQLQQQVNAFDPHALEQLMVSVKRARMQNLSISGIALILAVLSLLL